MRSVCLLLLCTLPFFSCSQEKRPADAAKSPAIEKPQETFTTLKFEVDGKPCTAVINNRFKNSGDKRNYPLSLFINVTADNAAKGNTDAFYKIQSLILDKLAHEMKLCHVGTTNMPGYHDIMLYILSENQEAASAILSKIKDGNPQLSSFTFEHDPEWEAVSSFYDAIPAN